MAPAERPGQRPVMRIPGPIRRSCRPGGRLRPSASAVRAVGGAQGVNRSSLHWDFCGVSPLCGPNFRCARLERIVVIGGVGGRRGPRAVYKPRPMGMNHIYGEFLEDGI